MAQRPRKSKSGRPVATQTRKTRKKEKRPLERSPATPLATLPARTQVLICLGFLLLVSLAFFSPIHFGGKAIVANDTTAYLSGAEAMLEYEAETGRPALWSPNMFSGMPGYLIRYPPRVPQADTVLNLLRRVVWPTSHLVALFAGMFVLAYRLTRDRWSSLLAAVAYGLTTYMPVILIAGHNTKFVSLCLAPWLLVAVHYGFERPRPLAALLMAIVVAVNLRGGHIQITYFYLFVLLIWWLAAGITAIRSGTVKPFMLSTATFAAGGVLGLLMAAQPYLATIEYKAFSIRGSNAPGEISGLAWESAMAWSQGVGELLTLVVSNAFGGSGAEYWGPKSITSGPHYLGLAVVAMAAFAAATVRRTVVTAFSVAAVLLTLFALGENFSLLNRPMFDHFPLFDAFRAPETWLSTVACMTAILAAIGLSAAVGSTPPYKRDMAGTGVRDESIWRKLVIVCGVAAVGLVLLLVMKDALLPFEKPGEFELIARNVAVRQQVAPDDPRVVQVVRDYLAQVRDARSELFVRDVVRSLLALAGTFFALLLFRRRRIGRDIAAVAIVLVVLVDLFGVGRRYIGEDTLVDQPTAEQRVPTYDFDDFIEQRVAEAGGSGHFRVLSLEASPMTNARPSYVYESVGGYHGAKLRNYQEFLENVLFQQGFASPNINGLDLLGVRFIVGQSVPLGFEQVYESSQTGMRVYERVGFEGRARIVGKVEVVSDGEPAWETIRSHPDIADVAILSQPLRDEVAAIDSSSTASVSVEHYDPRTARWRVESDAARLFVTGEVYYPAGWRATVDGKPEDILLVNGLFRGVHVQAGEHVVEMTFNPKSDQIGFLVSLLTTILVYGTAVMLLGMSFRRGARRDDDSDEGTPG